MMYNDTHGADKAVSHCPQEVPMGRFIGQSCAALLCGFMSGVVGIIPGVILGFLNPDCIPPRNNDFGYIFTAALFGGIIGYIVGAAVGTTLFYRAAQVTGRWWGAGIVCVICIWLFSTYRYLLWVDTPFSKIFLPCVSIAAPVVSALGYTVLPKLWLVIFREETHEPSHGFEGR
jgi:uncharacterized membrane protein YeaQ/YmgE (transglycosylase-associated protein family)